MKKILLLSPLLMFAFGSVFAIDYLTGRNRLKREIEALTNELHKLHRHPGGRNERCFNLELESKFEAAGKEFFARCNAQNMAFLDTKPGCDGCSEATKAFTQATGELLQSFSNCMEKISKEKISKK